MHDSILNHKNAKYLWWQLVIILAGIVSYVYVEYGFHPEVSFWFDYLSGGLGALIILWLTYYSKRKRSYKSRLGTTRGWLSAHVYIGLSLIVLVTLHTRFDFHWNIHLLAYILMLLVILIGILGVFLYFYYPKIITANAAQTTKQQRLKRIQELDKQCLSVASSIDEHTHSLVLNSIQQSTIGGGTWQQLTAGLHPHKQQEAIIQSISDRMSTNQDAQISSKLRQMLDLLTRRKDIYNRIQNEIRYTARMTVWLYIHIILTYALLAALLVHVITVFMYW